MKNIITDGESDYLWFALVRDAEFAMDCSIDEDLESYVVFLLASKLNESDLFDNILGESYLKAQNSFVSDKLPLKQVADTCLLLSGLYPDNSRRRGVSPDYFASLGIASYFQLSDMYQKDGSELSQVYRSISCDYYKIVRLLFYIRLSSLGNGLLQYDPILKGACFGCYDDVVDMINNRPNW